MPTEMETGLWPKLCAEVMDALGIQDGGENDHFKRVEKLYDRCINTCIPNDVRATDDARLRHQLRVFHALVLGSIKHIQTGWPSTTRGGVRDALSDAGGSSANAPNGAIGGSDRDSMDRAIDVALCLWFGVDCVDQHHLGAALWLEKETVEQFVLKRRFDAAVEADPRDHRHTHRADFYLDQHLRFNEETRTVKIFMDVAWLKAMIKLFQGVVDTPFSSDGSEPPADTSGVQASAGCQQNIQVDGQIPGGSQSQGVTYNASSVATPSLPTGNKQAAIALLPIFGEALHRLDVLFPAWHSKTIAFLETFREDGNKVPWFTLQDLTGQEQRYLPNFHFWRFRLTQLIVEYQSPPRDLKRIWNDRRNPTAYWTFWIGMAIFFLTLIFGIVASVLAGLALRNKSG